MSLIWIRLSAVCCSKYASGIDRLIDWTDGTPGKGAGAIKTPAAVLGYVFLVITAVFGIAAAWDWRHAWIVVLGIAALLHLGGAAALGLLARQRIKDKSFDGTLEELKKDHEWLTQLTKKN